MMRSMFSGVVGLRVHQTRMDVIGNNVANVNTIGYKGSRATFQELFSQTLRGASSPTQSTGGTNPVQVGMGVGLSSIDNVMTAGTLQLTGRDTDMAIEGNGFFVLGTGSALFYTRAGAFSRDADGYLVNAQNGLRLKGWMARPDGSFGARDRSSLENVRIPTGVTTLAQATQVITLGQSLDAESLIDEEYVINTKVYDSQGQQHTIVLKFKKVDINTWDVGFFQADGVTELTGNPDGVVRGTSGQTMSGGSFAGGVQLQFDADGRLIEAAANTPVFGSFDFDPANGAAPMTVNIDFSQVNQPAVPGDAKSTVQVETVDGYPMGSLDSFAIDARGIVFGVFSNGQRKALAQVATAVFTNPEGLIRVGGNAYVTSANSGLEQIGEPGTGGRGHIAPSNLEMSNVDLSAEFTNMIVTQRGFQANSRIITATDEMLQDLVNLKR